MEQNLEQDNIGIIATLKQQIINFINNPDAILAILTKVAIALVIFWVGKRIAKIIVHFLVKGVKKSGAAPMLVNFLRNFVYFLLMAFVILTALGELGVKTTSLLGMLAAAGLAIGLALKDSLANIASGVMIVIFRPFRIGDFVEVAGHAGKVMEIKIFNTVLNSGDNKQIIIPNGQITSGSIVNYSANDTRRIDFVIGVSYDDDLKLARNTMLEIMQEHPLVLEDPAPSAAVNNLGASSVDINVRPWVKTEDYWTVHAELLERFKVRLEEVGCSIPYPQTDVHLYKNES